MVEDVDVPTLAKAIFHEEKFRSSAKTEPPEPEESPAPVDPRKKSDITGQRLFALASQCRDQGMSGRALRRLPVLALAHYTGIGTTTTTTTLLTATKAPKVQIVDGSSKSRSASEHGIGNLFMSRGADISVWLDAMIKVVKDQASEHAKLS